MLFDLYISLLCVHHKLRNWPNRVRSTVILSVSIQKFGGLLVLDYQVLAVSDVIIYRTRADRLHNDLFTFLGNASVAFQRHFACELKTAADRFHLDDIAVSSLCPAVVIYHETQYTEPLRTGQVLRVSCIEVN